MSVIGSKLTSLFWTNRQIFRTRESSRPPPKKSTPSVRDAKYVPKRAGMRKLEGKVAVITGGSSGMALASAKRFVEEGAYVFITGRRQEQLGEAVKQIGRNVTGVRGDASN